ncbi:flagellar export chaperone FlgN [Demequina subtropica]|uniref:flagellar export chaperone FlgN n=1 Tax=Demequina subtropica TaxID=1638989 RepID=UPI000785DDB1|nr:flagellar export chaperone FlgN [Demequina subtropica]
MSFDELSAVLWRERELLETLLFKLEAEELIIASGRSRWLGRAAREVELVLDQIRAADLGRAAEADAAARSIGLDGDISLRDLAASAPAPWDEMLTAHHTALAALAAQIATLGESNRELLAVSLQATREALVGIEATVGTYDQKGTAARGTGAYLIDEAL